MNLSDTAKRVSAEFLATFVFIVIGIGSVAVVTYANATPTVLIIALGHGLGIIIGAIAFGSISGAHMNPAVTVAACLTQRLSIRDAIMYIAAQLTGATLAYALVLLLTDSGSSTTANLGVHGALGNGINVFEALGIEILITFILVMVIFVTAFDKRTTTALAPFAIGFVIFGTNLFAIPFTGASLNPARSYAPSLINWEWSNHWIYWVGPFVGSILAVLVYKIVFGDKLNGGTRN